MSIIFCCRRICATSNYLASIIKNNWTMENSESDVERRLRKALHLIEKLRTKYDFEKEVGQELALRNETLKKDIYNETEKYKHAIDAFDELYSTFFELWKEHEMLLSDGLPKDELSHQEMRAKLEEHRDSAERLKRLANPPSAKHKKKNRRASELGINIQAGMGTSLTRSRVGSTISDKRGSMRLDTHVENEENLESLDAEKEGTLSRKDTLAILPTAGGKVVPNEPALEGRRPSMESSVIDAEGDLEYYSTLSENTSAIAPLFEHFIVVGVPMNTAEDMLDKLNKQSASQEGVSSRWLRKLGLNKIVSGEQIPGQNSNGQGSNSELTTPKERSDSAHMEEAPRDSLWGISTNLFSSSDDSNSTARSNISGHISQGSKTVSKWGKMFSSNTKPIGEGTNEKDKSAKKSGRFSTTAIPTSPDVIVSEEELKRCDSTPAPNASSEDSLEPGGNNIKEEPFAETRESVKAANVLDPRDVSSKEKPPSGSSEQKSFSSALSR